MHNFVLLKFKIFNLNSLEVVASASKSYFFLNACRQKECLKNNFDKNFKRERKVDDGGRVRKVENMREWKQQTFSVNKMTVDLKLNKSRKNWARLNKCKINMLCVPF
jgi:hypothetical protein